MAHLVKDTAFGQLIYLASGRRFLSHKEEHPDFVLPERYQRNKRPRRESDDRTVVDGDASKEKGKQENGKKKNGEQEEGEDPNMVDWYGDDDPENPLNWSSGKKLWVVMCLCLITISVYMGSSIYSPGLKMAMKDMHVGQSPAALGLTMFVLGYAIGPMFLSPLTEIPAIGRTAPYIVTLAIFCVLQIPTALTSNFTAFIILRFLAGFFGSPPLATGGASISDMYGPRLRPIFMGLWGISAAAGPALGPVVSGFAIMNLTWHWHAWIMLYLSGFSLVFLFFSLPETSSINILVRRADRLRRLTGNQELKSEGEVQQAEMSLKEIATMTLFRPFQLTLTEPIVIALNAYISFVYILLYSWFESFPIVYEMGYGWNLGVSQLPFLSLMIGTIIGYFGIVWWNLKIYAPAFDKAGGELPPESRLPPAMVGAVCYPICLFWFGWSANRTSWVSPTIAAIFFGIGTTLMFNSVLNYLPDAYPKYAASVLASNDFLRGMLGGVFPLFASIMFKAMGIDWGCSMLGFVSCAMIPIPFVLYKYGEKIRGRSKFAN